LVSCARQHQLVVALLGSARCQLWGCSARPNLSNHSRLYPAFDGIDEGLGVAEEFELVEVSGFGA
jgi:hypothetical protein